MCVCFPAFPIYNINFTRREWVWLLYINHQNSKQTWYTSLVQRKSQHPKRDVKVDVVLCGCVLSGKRIPAVDGSGAAAGKGFKLQASSSSQRTCCWWCLWPVAPTLSPPAPSHPSTPRPPTCIRPASAHGHRHQAVRGCTVRSVTPRAQTPDAALAPSTRLEVKFPALSNSKAVLDK